MKEHNQTENLTFKSHAKHLKKIKPTSENTSVKGDPKSLSKNKRSSKKSLSKDRLTRAQIGFKTKTNSQLQKNEENQYLLHISKQSQKNSHFNETCCQSGKHESINLKFSKEKREDSNLKEGLSFGKKKQSKKDRKFSENTHGSLNDYQELKLEHVLEEKLLGMALNDKELHRLRKIYAVQEAQYAQKVFKSGELNNNIV